MAVYVLFFLAGLALAYGQSVRTVNGSLLLEVGGATLTLTNGGSGSGSSGSQTFATAADLTAAVANLLQQTQPQVGSFVFLYFIPTLMSRFLKHIYYFCVISIIFLLFLLFSLGWMAG